MTITIEKIRLINFKRFKDYTICPNKRLNILVGDNEVGKSSVLEAIELVSSGNVRRVENIGLDKLMNVESILCFNKNRKYENLPEMIIELFLKGKFDHTMNGKNNSLGVISDGIRLVCSPNDDYRNEINEFLKEETLVFPFEYYKIRFSTFSDETYSGYKKKLKTVLINSSIVDSEYATNNFIEKMYQRYTEENELERIEHRSKFRQMKFKFCEENLKLLNSRVPSDKKYKFALQNNYSKIFSNELMIYEDSIALNNRGTGEQVLIKTDFALEKAGENIDVILFEEPENHLSHTNLKKLISNIENKQTGQIFVTTHSSLISTGLDLFNLIILSHKKNDVPLYLKTLNKDTSNYFLKAPPAGILEFILSSKVILVEGPSEYILFDRFYKYITGRHLNEDRIYVLAIRGLSFKRYLDIAKITGSRVAVITDNDSDYEQKCIKKYENYNYDNIEIFFENDNDKPTFEYYIYDKNRSLCETKFGVNALDHMLKNKTNSALMLAESENITTPKYIERAINWIRK
ncbi:MAG: AAA family ATPase [Anaerococcus prevotii]|nr:AAA family ATPase [Anaerococcus prevotii]